MAYPAGVITRTVTCGGSAAVESGTDLVLSVSIEASRGLICDGERMPSSPEVKTSIAGGEVSFDLPVSDQSGYRDEATLAVIDVSAPDSHTHTYTATITTTRGATGLVNQRVVTFPLPTGDLSPVDVDTLIEVGIVDGVLVSVPDSWGAMVAQAVAAAGSASAAAASAAAADADRIAADAAASAAAANAATATADATTAANAATAAEAARDLAEASAALAGIDVTPSPDYPGTVLRIAYPAHVSPAPNLIRLPIGA